MSWPFKNCRQTLPIVELILQRIFAVSEKLERVKPSWKFTKTYTVKEKFTKTYTVKKDFTKTCTVKSLLHKNIKRTHEQWKEVMEFQVNIMTAKPFELAVKKYNFPHSILWSIFSLFDAFSSSSLYVQVGILVKFLSFIILNFFNGCQTLRCG